MENNIANSKLLGPATMKAAKARNTHDTPTDDTQPAWSVPVIC